LRAPAQGTVQIDLARLDSGFEPRFGPEVETSRRLQHKRPLQRAGRDLDVIERQAFRGEFDGALRRQIRPKVGRRSASSSDGGAGDRDRPEIAGGSAGGEAERSLCREPYRQMLRTDGKIGGDRPFIFGPAKGY
jgi:hypothetical protein